MPKSMPKSTRASSPVTSVGGEAAARDCETAVTAATAATAATTTAPAATPGGRGACPLLASFWIARSPRLAPARNPVGFERRSAFCWAGLLFFLLLQHPRQQDLGARLVYFGAGGA